MLADAARATLIEELAELVHIPSCSDAGGGLEGRVQGLVAQRLRDAGARVQTFEVDDLPDARKHPLFCGPQRDYANRPTVVGEIGPADAPALVVMAHSDTVPPGEPEQWSVDPFGGVVRDGCLYGLGSGDDKWGVAALLALARAFAARPPRNKRLVLASTIDEENGVGNGLLLLMLAGVGGEAALYLDGGELEMWIGNCGGSNLYLRPRAAMADDDFARDAATLAAAAAEFSAARAGLFDRPYFRENMRRGSSVGVARRGDAGGSFHLVFFYTLPGEQRGPFVVELERRVAAALGPRLDAYERSYREPWFEPALADPAAGMLPQMSAAYRALAGAEPRVGTTSKQDAFIFQNHARIPTVSFGVARISGPGAFHCPDERVDVDVAWTGLRIVHDAVARWLGGD